MWRGAIALLPALALGACPAASPDGQSGEAAGDAGAREETAPAPSPGISRRSASSALAADTPGTTAAGHTFVAPAGWSLTVRGAASILEAPEGNSRIALIDVQAKEPDAAIAEAWSLYGRPPQWQLAGTRPGPDRNGWSGQRVYSYRAPPGEHRTVEAGVMQRDGRWLAWIYDVDNGVADKRSAAISLIFDSLLPEGYSRESFAGREAHALDGERLDELVAFVERTRQALDIPGVSLGLLQRGRKVFAGGFGVRELGREERPDADTLYLVASVTKPLTTLMLAKLVEEGKLTWETPVTRVLPQFALGDADTTRNVQIRHLVCACTGLPRQDFEWLMEFQDATPATTLAMLRGMQPTSGFGEMFQYSNLLAAAGGFVGGQVRFPGTELGEAYDRAMQALVFDPLGMNATTFDFQVALAGNHASAHALDVDGNPTRSIFDVNYAIVPVRPAGGAWSNVNDLLKYVAMELAGGRLPGGSRYVAADVLNERSEPNVRIGNEAAYGMGLVVSSAHGVRTVGHPGSMFGYRSQVFWLPDHDVGAVILTNADQGWTLTSAVERRLLELLFDGEPRAEDDVRVAAEAMRERIASERELLAIPPDRAAAARLADRYENPALGEVTIRKAPGDVVFDFGEWRSRVASRENPDGTVSFVTIVPGFSGVELVAGEADGRRTLTLRNGQHEYVFREKS
ncbi:MAG TPA: serine hydrolase [Woeseiaceae bacterium]|nr:serine hydrolase [Woeseiaceae bacterium]